MARTRYLVVVYVVTAGLHGEDLGSDEEDIVLFSWLVVDISNCRVCTVLSSLLIPVSFTLFIIIFYLHRSLTHTDLSNEADKHKHSQSGVHHYVSRTCEKRSQSITWVLTHIKFMSCCSLYCCCRHQDHETVYKKMAVNGKKDENFLSCLREWYLVMGLHQTLLFSEERIRRV